MLSHVPDAGDPVASRLAWIPGPCELTLSWATQIETRTPTNGNEYFWSAVKQMQRMTGRWESESLGWEGALEAAWGKLVEDRHSLAQKHPQRRTGRGVPMGHRVPAPWRPPQEPAWGSNEAPPCLFPQGPAGPVVGPARSLRFIVSSGVETKETASKTPPSPDPGDGPGLSCRPLHPHLSAPHGL